MSTARPLHPTRRNVVAGLATLTVWGAIPRLAYASGRDPRLVFVILRGGLDGLAAVAPVGDPSYEAARAGFVLPADGPHPRFALDSIFALNGRMPATHDMWRAGEALFVHAAHTPYRDRSHFSAQDVLENGTTSDSEHRDGWLGRALGVIPVAERIKRGAGLGVGADVPLVLRGGGEVLTWMPADLPDVTSDTRRRLLDLYEHTDPALAGALASGLALEKVTGSGMEMRAPHKPAPHHRAIAVTADSVGKILSQADGPRIGVLDLTGFDTHRLQDSNLAEPLAVLDLLLGSLKQSLRAVWPQTVVVVATEFGRTVHINGSQGTDHGMATVSMLVGGAVKGGRVVADWPGLAPAALYENRDLRPTTDIRAVFKGVLRDHLDVADDQLASRVFPESSGVKPISGLIRA